MTPRWLKFSRTQIGLFFALATLIALCVFVFWHEKDSDPVIVSCSNQQEQEYIECLKAEMLVYARDNPWQVDEMQQNVFDNARKVHKVDLRNLSNTAHHIGMVLANNEKVFSLEDGALACGTAFKSGCFHGFVMQKYENENSDKSVGFLLSYCEKAKNQIIELQYLNCVHAIGHELWATTDVDLDELLDQCDNAFTEEAAKSACMSGIFMEYSSSGYQRTGTHSHEEVGKIDLPCGSLKDDYARSICYPATASYKQYTGNTEPISRTVQYCRDSPLQYRQHCLSQIVDRLTIAFGGSESEAYDECQKYGLSKSECQ